MLRRRALLLCLALFMLLLLAVAAYPFVFATATGRGIVVWQDSTTGLTVSKGLTTAPELWATPGVVRCALSERVLVDVAGVQARWWECAP